MSEDHPELIEPPKEDYSIFTPSMSSNEEVSKKSILNFINITGSGENVARAFLVRHRTADKKENLEYAIQMYFENSNPLWLREALEPKVKAPGDLEDFQNLSVLERCAARAETVLEDLRTKLENKDSNAQDIMNRVMKGEINVIPERVIHLAVVLAAVKDGMRDLKDKKARFGMSLPVARKLLNIFEDCHLTRYHPVSYKMDETMRVILVAILHALLYQIEMFCMKMKPGDVVPSSLIASIVTISRPYLRIYLAPQNARLRDEVKLFVNKKTKFWDFYAYDLKRPLAVLELDRLLPIFYCFPDDDTSVRILLGTSRSRFGSVFYFFFLILEREV